MSYGPYTPGTPSTLPDNPPHNPPPSRIGGIAILVAVLAVVVVLGVVAGIVVWTVNGGMSGPLGNGTPSSSAPASPGPASGTPDAPPPTGSPGPPVAAANLPTSGDLAWPPPLSWKVEATAEGPQDAATAPCQTWKVTGEPPETAVQVRTYTLQPGAGQQGNGRAVAYAISYATEVDAARAVDAAIADGLGCGARLGGRQGPRMDVDLPLGQGAFTDVVWTDAGASRTGAWGVARHGSRVVWLWAEIPGDGTPWVGHADGHPMAASLARALGRLRY